MRLSARQILKYLGSGLITLFPAAMTIWVVSAVVRWLTDALGPNSTIGQLLQPKQADGPAHWLVMVIVYGFALVLIALLGYGTHKRALNWFVDLMNLFFSRFPLINRVYGALQQVANVMRSQTGGETGTIAKFGDVVFVRYANLQILALLTSRRVYRVGGQPHVQVFLPHSPMPATGLLFFSPVEDVLLTNLDIEDYTKIEVSFGSLTSQTIPRGMRCSKLEIRKGGVEPIEEQPESEPLPEAPTEAGTESPV